MHPPRPGAVDRGVGDVARQLVAVRAASHPGFDRVEVLHPRPVRRDPRGASGFAAALIGRRVDAARRRGKYFWLALDNGDALLGHLGMSGQLLVQPASAPAERAKRIAFSASPSSSA